MNRDEWEQRILLAESGELAEEDRRALEALLAADPDAAAFRADTRTLLAAARSTRPVDAMSPVLNARLRAAAGARHPQSTGWFRPLALAATLAIIAGATLWRQPAVGRHDRIAEMHAMVAMTDTASIEGVTLQPAQDADAALRNLAQRLLVMEGLAAAEYVEEGLNGEVTTPTAELSPTAFQPRSISALPPRTYG